MYNKADDLANNAKIRNESEKALKQVKKKTSPPAWLNIRAEITEKYEGTEKVAL